jgi:hypothetical protein
MHQSATTGAKGERKASEKLNAGEAKYSPQLPTAERVYTVTGKMTKSPVEWIVLDPQTLRIRQSLLCGGAQPDCEPAKARGL